LRYAQLTVTGGVGGLDISEQRFRFEVRASDSETPNSLVCRVYNLSRDTEKEIIKEFDQVTLTCGYQNGNKALIFQGTIKQFRRGKERNVDSYLDILAADGDVAYNFGTVNKTIPAGATRLQELGVYADQMDLPISQSTVKLLSGDNQLLSGGVNVNISSKLAFGMGRDYVRLLAEESDCRWSVQNGKLIFIPNSGYLPGDIVDINSATGMLGTPESTDAGIKVRCYLNPLITIGRLIHLNNADINQTIFPSSNKSQLGVGYNDQCLPATTSDDGYYRVLVAEHVGDTRGNDWYTELTCLVVDISSGQIGG
jgi:hypothetical protein